MMNIQQKAARLKPLAIALSALILTGCASFSKDGGFDNRVYVDQGTHGPDSPAR